MDLSQQHEESYNPTSEMNFDSTPHQVNKNTTQIGSTSQEPPRSNSYVNPFENFLVRDDQGRITIEELEVAA